MLFSGPSLRLVFHYLRTPRPSQSTRKYATEQSQSQGKKSSEMPKSIFAPLNIHFGLLAAKQ